MLNSFSTALSALKANETAIDVVGNNLANLNTPGFKASVIEFSDMVSRSMGSGMGDTQVGFGVATPRTRRDFSQGPLQPSSGALTAGIQGSGFFVLQGSSGETLFSRAGSFRIDLGGNLITATGEKVMGYPAVNGAINPSGAISPITIPTGAILPPKATTTLSMDANLDVDAADGTEFKVPMKVVDSLGKTHVLNFTFTKSATANEWDYAVDIDPASGGSVAVAGSGTLTFGSDGKLTGGATGETITVTGLDDGADDMDITWDFMNPDGTSRLTQYAGASNPSAIAQDGYTAAELLQVGIGDGGLVVAQYSNGRLLTLAQLAVAGIRNPDTLIGAGNNTFLASASTADPAIGASGTGGRGKIVGGSLEGSRVDIAEEFTKLITYQRGYQVNSRVISTADEISQEVINLKR